jgi:hypothetical protein
MHLLLQILTMISPIDDPMHTIMPLMRNAIFGDQIKHSPSLITPLMLNRLRLLNNLSSRRPWNPIVLIPLQRVRDYLLLLPRKYGVIPSLLETHYYPISIWRMISLFMITRFLQRVNW